MYQNIKSYEDACAFKGINPVASLPIVTGVPEDLREFIINTYKLAIVNQAINGTWRADYGNHRQRKWYPWFLVKENYAPGSAGGFSFNDCDFVFTLTYVGGRLVYETEEQAEYAGTQFLDLYEKVQLIPKQ